MFIYTDETDYATNEDFHGNDVIYERQGTYKYQNILIKAYRQTENKISDIEYKTYLQDKNLRCCMNDGKIVACPTQN